MMKPGQAGCVHLFLNSGFNNFRTFFPIFSANYTTSNYMRFRFYRKTWITIIQIKIIEGLFAVEETSAKLSVQIEIGIILWRYSTSV